MDIIKSKIKSIVKNIYGLDFDTFVIEHPQNEKFGDFATNIGLVLAKELNRKPLEIAEEIAGELERDVVTFEKEGHTYNIFSKICAVQPGFVNFVLSDEWLNGQLEDTKVEYEQKSNNEKILIEYSQPNPNKPQHIGHARNNFLGSTLANIYSYLGYNVITANYFNDWGTHICKSMLMCDRYGNNEEPKKKSDHFVGDQYIKYSQEEQKDESIKEDLQKMFQKLEAGDEKTIELWKKITSWAYKGWEQTYKDQNVSFDTIFKQSNYKDIGKEIVDLAVKKGIAEKDETGAVIARLEKYGLPDKVLLRSDGTSIYITQDLQLAKDAFDEYNLDKRLYVVDNRQSDYFRQLFKILSLLGFDYADKLHHVSYGFVSLPEGQMSSRTGLVVNADDVFENIKKVEAEEIETSIKNITNKEDTINKVSLAAFRYGILKIDPKKDVVFRYDQVTKFEGNTGPYLMYTYARMNSVLEKSGFDPDNMPDIYTLLTQKLEDKERDILRSLYKFNDVVKQAGDDFAPHILANYLYDLTQRFNSFYAQHKILDAQTEEKRIYRLLLTLKAANILKTGLNLLGINTVEKM